MSAPTNLINDQTRPTAPTSWADARARAQALWADLGEEDFEAAGESIHALRGIIRRRFSAQDPDIEARLDTLRAPVPRAWTSPTSEPNPLLLARWAHVRRLALEAWPQLDAADFERAGGSTERLRGLIRGRFGGTDAAIMGILARWVDEPLHAPARATTHRPRRLPRFTVSEPAETPKPERQP